MSDTDDPDGADDPDGSDAFAGAEAVRSATLPGTSLPAPVPAAPPMSPDGGRPVPWLEVLAFAAIYLIWGSTYLGIRIAVRTLPPFLMAGCRFVLAGAALYAILRVRGVPAPRRGHWARAAVAGMLMLTLGNGLVTWSEQRVPSNLAALMIAAVPLFTAALDWLRPGGRRPPVPVFVGIALGAAGMALLVANRGAAGHPGSATPTSLLAVLALLLAALTWAVGSLYSRYGSMHPHPLMAASQQMVMGGAALLLIAIGQGEPTTWSRSMVTLPGVAAFVYLTLFGSLLAFSAFGWLVKVSTPARVSTTAYVNPVVAVALGWFVLGERLTPGALGGAALIVCAVVVMTAGSSPLRWGSARLLGGARQRGHG